MRVRKVMGNRGLRVKGHSWEIMISTLDLQLNIKFPTKWHFRMRQAVWGISDFENPTRRPTSPHQIWGWGEIPLEVERKGRKLWFPQRVKITWFWAEAEAPTPSHSKVFLWTRMWYIKTHINKQKFVTWGQKPSKLVHNRKVGSWGLKPTVHVMKNNMWLLLDAKGGVLPQKPGMKGGRWMRQKWFTLSFCLGLSSPTLSSKPKWFSLLCLKGILTWKEMDLSAWSISQWEAEMSLRSNCLGPGQDVSSHSLGPWRHRSAPKAAVSLKEKNKETLSQFSKDLRQIIEGLMPGILLRDGDLWKCPCSPKSLNDSLFRPRGFV